MPGGSLEEEVSFCPREGGGGEGKESLRQEHNRNPSNTLSEQKQLIETLVVKSLVPRRVHGKAATTLGVPIRVTSVDLDPRVEHLAPLKRGGALYSGEGRFVTSVSFRTTKFSRCCFSLGFVAISGSQKKSTL